MYGWRARLGILVPSMVLPTEPEFYLMRPEGVSIHFSRFFFTGSGGDPEKLKVLKNLLPEAARLLATTGCQAMAMCCTAGSFIGGYGYDQELIRIMQEANGGLPTTTASTSIYQACRYLGVKRIAMATPYEEVPAKIERQFMEDNGLEVVDLVWCPNKAGYANYADFPPEKIFEIAKRADKPEAEAIFISCVDLHVVAIIQKLEQDLGKPVISSNQACFWHTLRLAGVNEKIEGYGTLLTNPS